MVPVQEEMEALSVTVVLDSLEEPVKQVTHYSSLEVSMWHVDGQFCKKHFGLFIDCLELILLFL